MPADSVTDGGLNVRRDAALNVTVSVVRTGVGSVKFSGIDSSLSYRRGIESMPMGSVPLEHTLRASFHTQPGAAKHGSDAVLRRQRGLRPWTIQRRVGRGRK